jgi:hypothetical protein
MSSGKTYSFRWFRGEPWTYSTSPSRWLGDSPARKLMRRARTAGSSTEDSSRLLVQKMLCSALAQKPTGSNRIP